MKTQQVDTLLCYLGLSWSVKWSSYFYSAYLICVRNKHAIKALSVLQKKQKGLDHLLTHVLTGRRQVHIPRGWAQNWGVQGIAVVALASAALSSEL